MKHLILIAFFVLLSTSAYAYTYPKEFDQPWDHSPITFALNKSFPPECDPTYIDDFYKSLEYWKNGGNGRLSFVPEFREVATNEKPDIIIYWVKTVQNVSEEIGGLTSLIVQPGKKFVSAKIQLACIGFLKSNGNEVSREFSHKEMYITSAHELGHALALEHTDDPYDIMTRKQTIQIYPVSFETSSFEVDLNLTPRRTMPGEPIRLFGKTGANMKLDFLELYSNKTVVSFLNNRVTTDSSGFFENFVTFNEPGRYLVEVASTLSPNIYASSVIFVERGAEVQINSETPAEIILNSESVGFAPKKLKDLKYGAHEIICKASGYKNYKTLLTVRQGNGYELKAEPSRDAILCALEKIEAQEPAPEKEKNFLDKFMEAIREFFRILLS